MLVQTSVVSLWLGTVFPAWMTGLTQSTICNPLPSALHCAATGIKFVPHPLRVCASVCGHLLSYTAACRSNQTHLSNQLVMGVRRIKAIWSRPRCPCLRGWSQMDLHCSLHPCSCWKAVLWWINHRYSTVFSFPLPCKMLDITTKSSTTYHTKWSVVSWNIFSPYSSIHFVFVSTQQNTLQNTYITYSMSQTAAWWLSTEDLTLSVVKCMMLSCCRNFQQKKSMLVFANDQVIDSATVNVQCDW